MGDSIYTFMLWEIPGRFSAAGTTLPKDSHLSDRPGERCDVQ